MLKRPDHIGIAGFTGAQLTGPNIRCDPDAALAAVADHWPPERPTGRPPRTPGGSPADPPHVGPQDHVPPAEPGARSDHDATTTAAGE
jgi:hypothetical protein